MSPTQRPAMPTPFRIARHPQSERLAKSIARCLPLASPWSGDWIRTAPTPYSGAGVLLNGRGASDSGGRWKPPGILAVYLTTNARTALAEWLGRLDFASVPVEQRRPRLWVFGCTRLDRVLDLTRADVQSILAVSVEQLCEEWWDEQERGIEALPQALGRLAHDSGLHGLFVPSAADRPSGTNLVVYPDTAGGDWYEIYFENELPPSGA